MKKDNSGNAKKCELKKILIHEYAHEENAKCAKVRTKKGVSLHDTRMGRNLEFPGIVEFMDTITRGRKMQENANKKREPVLTKKPNKKEFVNTIYAREHPDIPDTLKGDY